MKLTKIKKITKLNKVYDRYDLTIPKNHNFFANNILIHNTSHREAFLKKYNYLNKFKKLCNKYLPFKFEEYKYEYVYGSRRVTFEKNKEDGYYKNTTFRETVHEQIVKAGLHPGETIYLEIVGYTGENGASIMGAQGIKDKELKKLYGDSMIYSYGCAVNTPDVPQFDTYVYRMTRTLEDNSISEVPYYQMVSRCKEMGLKVVPELSKPFIYDGDSEKLLEQCKTLADGHSTVDSSHIREGIVLRVDHPGLETNFKLKSFNFKLLEGILKDKSDYVDLEEIS